MEEWQFFLSFFNTLLVESACPLFWERSKRVSPNLLDRRNLRTTPPTRNVEVKHFDLNLSFRVNVLGSYKIKLLKTKRKRILAVGGKTAYAVRKTLLAWI
jgi:hypothetical protein